MAGAVVLALGSTGRRDRPDRGPLAAWHVTLCGALGHAVGDEGWHPERLEQPIAQGHFQVDRARPARDAGDGAVCGRAPPLNTVQHFAWVEDFFAGA